MSLSSSDATAGGRPLPVEGHLPGFDGATGWLNSAPLTDADLRGKVVLVDFWTYTCINWLRTLALRPRVGREVRAIRGWSWSASTRPSSRSSRTSTTSARGRRTWRSSTRSRSTPTTRSGEAFANHYWPALYIADAQGRIRHHQFGEGGYDECETVIQQLLREAGREDIGDDLVSVAPDGVEAQADWDEPGVARDATSATEQGQNFASPGGAALDEPRVYAVPESLRLNQWALSGEWTVERRASVLNRADGRIAFRFHARDVNLVLRLADARGRRCRSACSSTARLPEPTHGLDVDEEGHGTLVQPRLYQLVRQPGSITDRTFEITFLAPGVEAYVFTFG